MFKNLLFFATIVFSYSHLFIENDNEYKLLVQNYELLLEKNNIKKENVEKLQLFIENDVSVVNIDDLAKLKNLRELHLTGEKTIHGLENLKNLQDLKSLAICDFENFGMLKKLNFSNLFSSNSYGLASSIFDLENLIELCLSSNAIRKIPDLSKLTKLEELVFGNNKIEIVPESISKLKSLKKIRFIDNQIKEWPKSAYEFPELIELDLAWNPIERLPAPLIDYLANSTKFEKLHLKDCDNFLDSDSDGNYGLKTIREKLGSRVIKY